MKWSNMRNRYLQNLNKIEFVVTDVCMGKCLHCSAGEDPVHGDRLDPTVAADAVRRITSIYTVRTVMAFGGEPLLHPDAVFAIMAAARAADVPHRQVITAGFFTRDEDEIFRVARLLAQSGVNDLLVSADAFHEACIPLEAVRKFVLAAKACEIPIRLQPAWLVSAADDNPYNRRTREILASFADAGIFPGEGNVIFPEGNARKYLAEYFADVQPENPYKENPCDVHCISFSANGDVLGDNVGRRDILDIIRDYRP